MEATEKRTGYTLLTALLIALLGLTGIAAFAAPITTEQVTISGRLVADGAACNDALVVVEVGHEACLWSELREDGRFTFLVPLNAQVRLVFMKPGYLTKEVLVDTRNALATDRAEHLNKNVRFDVHLEEVEQHLHEAYLGPVGYISFVNGTGLMSIRYDGRMRPAPAPPQDVALEP